MCNFSYDTNKKILLGIVICFYVLPVAPLILSILEPVQCTPDKLSTICSFHRKIFEPVLRAGSCVTVFVDSTIWIMAILKDKFLWMKRLKWYLLITAAGILALPVIESLVTAHSDSYAKDLIDRAYNLFREKGSNVDYIQQAYKCCGVEGVSFYKNQTIPISCYPDKDATKEVYQEGCAQTIIAYFKRNAIIIAILISPVIVLDVINFFVAKSQHELMEEDY